MARKPHTIDSQVLKLLQEYRRALRNAGYDIEQMFLFGSVAKGTERVWSDIDVAVVSPQFGRDRFEERVQLARLGNRISLAIEPHPFHPEDLANRWNSLAAEVRKDGISISER